MLISKLMTLYTWTTHTFGKPILSRQSYFCKRLGCYKLQKRSCPFISKYALEPISVGGISRSKWINLVTSASVLSHIPSQGTCWRDFRKPFINSCYGQGDEDLVYQMQLRALSFSLFSHFLRQVQRAGSWGPRCPLDINISSQNRSLRFGPKYLLSCSWLITLLLPLYLILMVHALFCGLLRKTLEFYNSLQVL